MAEVFRRIKNNNYTVMCNHHLQNERLSLKAMGLMSKLLSLPDDWSYSVRGIAAICKDGYESVRTAFLELIQEGYVVRQKVRDDHGHIIRTEYFILETPDTKIPEEYLVDVDNQKKTLQGSAIKEASANWQKENAENKNTVQQSSLNSPGLENPILDGKTEKILPGSNFPTTENSTVDSPGSDFPTTENRHQQNTIITNNNISLSSSTCKKNILYITPEKRMEEEEEIKKRIGYQQLLSNGHEPVIVNAILDLMIDFCAGKRKMRSSTYIAQMQVPTEQVIVHLKQLTYTQINAVLSNIRNGPEIRNLRSYLLTALYQADLTCKLNKYRSANRKNTFNNFHQRDYDYTKLEQALLNTEDEEKRGKIT